MTKLELNLPEKTIKKLRAYAMLTGSPISALESKLVDLVDKTLTDSIANALVSLDGSVPEAFTSPSEWSETKGQQLPSFSHEVNPVDMVTAPTMKEVLEDTVTQDEQSGNELSDEDAPETVKGLDEEEDPVNEEELKVEISAPNAGNNADAYLDAVLAQDAGAKKISNRTRKNGGYQSAAGIAFDPRSPRVTIQEHTGDETAEFNF